MVGAWILKILAGIALAGFLVVEAGSPVVVRLQLDDVAHDAARAGATVAQQGGSLEQARDAAVAVASTHEARVDTFTVHSDRSVSLTLAKRAPALALDRIGPIAGWWRVEVDATGVGAGRPPPTRGEP